MKGMKGREPKFYIGKTTHLPKVRVLIQEERPDNTVKGGWVSMGGHHIMCYGTDRKAIFNVVYGALSTLNIDKEPTMRVKKHHSFLMRAFRRIRGK